MVCERLLRMGRKKVTMSEYVFDVSAFESEELDDGMREGIVRCWDCIYLEVSGRYFICRHCDCFIDSTNGFCAWGERLS